MAPRETTWSHDADVNLYHACGKFDSDARAQFERLHFCQIYHKQDVIRIVVVSYDPGFSFNMQRF